MVKEEMFCPFCAGDDVREIDFTIEGDSIFRCFDCKKIFVVQPYFEKDGRIISEEQYLGETED